MSREQAPCKPARSLSHRRKRIAASESPEEALGEILGFAETRCGAHARSRGRPCLRRKLANGRCRNHGGLSTGARTEAGLRRALLNLRQFQGRPDHPALLEALSRRPETLRNTEDGFES